MGNAVAEAAEVIQPARTRTRVERGAAGLELHRRGCGTGATGFLFLWLIGWTVGCVVLAHQVIGKRELFMLVFAIPFWASWFLVAGIIAYGLFGFERLQIGRSGVEVFKGIAGWTVIRRNVPLSELRRAKPHKSSYEVNEEPVWGVQIRTAGKPIILAVGVEADEREWLIAIVNQELDTLGVVDVPVESPVSSTQVDRDALARATSAPRPSDSVWEMAPSVSGLEFVRRGRFRLGTFAGLTFINLFWNGIVSVFVMVLFGLAPMDEGMAGGQWWFLFFFLIPFEAIGLTVLVMWLASLTTPGWRDTLTLDRHEILFRFSVFGAGRTRRFPTADLSGLAVLHRPPKSRTSPPLRGEGDWQLVLADRTSREVLRIKHLTEGEANWIAASIRKMYPRTFKTPAP